MTKRFDNEFYKLADESEEFSTDIRAGAEDLPTFAKSIEMSEESANGSRSQDHSSITNAALVQALTRIIEDIRTHGMDRDPQTGEVYQSVTNAIALIEELECDS